MKKIIGSIIVIAALILLMIRRLIFANETD